MHCLCRVTCPTVDLRRLVVRLRKLARYVDFLRCTHVVSEIPVGSPLRRSKEDMCGEREVFC